MFLNKISLLNYRNIEECELEFSPKINCFLGRNGMGKTNLLDAIYFLSFCKSHLNNIDRQLIRYNADFFMLQGWYQKNGNQELISCGVKTKQRKQFLRNKKEYERLSDHIGFVPLVIISPSDLLLIQGGSDERRRFLDLIISQYDKDYLQKLIAYSVALQNRNALLKMPNLDLEMLEMYELQMAQNAQPIFEKRSAFIEHFLPLFKVYYARISDENESVDLRYESQLQNADLLKLFGENRDKDRILGFSTCGIHRDDLGMYMHDFPLKKAASQGQNKTFLVAMKLAQFALLKQFGHVKPILLLDDVFDKLDAQRVKNIVEIVSTDDFGQIFITDTNRQHIDEILNASECEKKLFFVENGKIVC